MTTRRSLMSKTLRSHLYGAYFGAILGAVVIKVFWFTDVALATALSPEFSAIIVAFPTFIAVAIGIQKWVPQPGPSPYAAHHREHGDDQS